MRKTFDERLIRVLAAALLQSDLSADELRRLSSDVLLQERISAAVRRILLAVAGEKKYDRSFERHQTGADGDVDRVYDLIQRRRLSKSAVAGILRSIRPTEEDEGFENESTLRLMLDRFLKDASTREKTELLTLLSPGAQKDPYLDEILKRR